MSMAVSLGVSRPTMLLAFAAVVIGIQAWRTPRMHPDALCCDHFYYRSMAANIPTVTRAEWDVVQRQTLMPVLYTDVHGARYLHAGNPLRWQPPYCYRLLTPLLVGVLTKTGLSIDLGFYALTAAGLVLACWGIGLIVARTAPVWCAAVAMVAFATHGALTAVNLFDFMLVDPLTYAALALGIYALIHDRRALFFVVTTLGVFNKEIVAALLPCAVLMHWRRTVPWRTVIASTLILVVYAAARWLVPVPVNTYSLFTAFVGVPPHIVFNLWGLFGALGVTAVARFWRGREGWGLLPFFAALGISACCVSDVLRVYVLGFPALVAISTMGMTSLSVVLPSALLVVQRMLGGEWLCLLASVTLELHDGYRWMKCREAAARYCSAV